MDKAQEKRRPALVTSSRAVFGRRAGHSVMAMITSAQNPPWPLDVEVSIFKSFGSTTMSTSSASGITATVQAEV